VSCLQRAAWPIGYGLPSAGRGAATVAPLRRGSAVGLAVLLAAAAAGAARGDGDPASDVLPTETVYLPLAAPSSEAQTALQSAVDAVYANGDRIRVAVIATPRDLGAVPSLMNKPDDYAKFLGQELAGFYVGPLLIVMPSGFGIYDGGRSVSAEQNVLGGVAVNGSSVDGLVRSAAAAVQKLEAANALQSPDIRAPYAYPVPTTLHPGKPATLQFRLLDDSNRSSAAITVTAAGKTVATLSSPLAPTNYPQARSVTWNVPKTIAKKRVQFCITATDGAGNKSTQTCVPLKVAKK